MVLWWKNIHDRKDKEKDILVSYDKTLRDKKSEKTLSTEGMSLSSAWGDIKYADIVNGYMYYLYIVIRGV